MINKIKLDSILNNYYSTRKPIMVITNYQVQKLNQFLKDLQEIGFPKLPKITSSNNEIIELKIDSSLVKDIERIAKRKYLKYKIYV